MSGPRGQMGFGGEEEGRQGVQGGRQGCKGDLGENFWEGARAEQGTRDVAVSLSWQVLMV